MACNCNKCNPNKHCGCNDSSLATPCSYSDCSVGSERCADVQCMECVSYCGTTFQISSPDGSGVIRIETGDRLDSIIQKFTMILTQGLGPCTSEIVDHAPYNLFATDITSSQATIQWNHVSSLTTSLQVQYKIKTAAIWTSATTINTPTTTLSYVLSTLSANETYQVKLVTGTTNCESVIIEFTTLTA